MAKFAHQDVLDGGLNAIKNGATRMLLVASYAANDSYATVTGGANIVASATMAPGDFLLSGTSNRVLTTATKSATAINAATAGDGHIVFTNGVDKVLWATDETGEAAVASGDTVNFPALTYTSNQPA